MWVRNRTLCCTGPPHTCTLYAPRTAFIAPPPPPVPPVGIHPHTRARTHTAPHRPPVWDEVVWHVLRTQLLARLAVRERVGLREKVAHQLVVVAHNLILWRAGGGGREGAAPGRRVGVAWPCAHRAARRRHTHAFSVCRPATQQHTPTHPHTPTRTHTHPHTPTHTHTHPHTPTSTQHTPTHPHAHNTRALRYTLCWLRTTPMKSQGTTRPWWMSW
jgi:hypothetical protein